jgi:hypothetical protein
MEASIAKPAKKRIRIRKPKTTEVDEPAAIDDEPVEEPVEDDKLNKKRGRKPKGGKIIVNSYLNELVHIPEPNIILHLKCGETDLIQNNLLSSITNVETFQFEQNKSNDLTYQLINGNTIEHSSHYNPSILSDMPGSNSGNSGNSGNSSNSGNNKNTANDDMKVIWDKLKELTYHLHTNNISDKKSACFWCTCDFDNPSIFIPKHELNHTYYCYGCFCSPECATAFLFKESIDTSTRFERYHLLNHIYCKIYDYKKNIKPAPDPFYTLNKYYGNLSIQEYRRLLKNERLLLVVDKPLSRTLPELHEDNDDFIYNGKNIPSSTKFKLRRKNKQSKTDILSDTFNLH